MFVKIYIEIYRYKWVCKSSRDMTQTYTLNWADVPKIVVAETLSIPPPSPHLFLQLTLYQLTARLCFVGLVYVRNSSRPWISGCKAVCPVRVYLSIYPFMFYPSIYLSIYLSSSNISQSVFQVPLYKSAGAASRPKNTQTRSAHSTGNSICTKIQILIQAFVMKMKCI